VADPAVVMDEILRWRNQRPFVPYTIVFESGERYDVTYRLALALNEQMVGMFPPGKGLRTFRLSEVAAVLRRRYAR
jgi:hypothetical protein